MNNNEKFRKYKKDEDVIKFFSNAKDPYYKLSNFACIDDRIKVFGRKFYSTEHAFQSRKFIKEDRKKFSSSGDIGNVDDGFDLLLKKMK